MNSTEAKIALLSYCRFARQMHYVSTEVGVSAGCLADVLASNGTDLIEYEIKVSMSDLTKDSEKPKHIIYDPTPIEWNGMIGKKGYLVFQIKAVESHWNKDHKFELFRVDGDRSVGFSNWLNFSTIEQAKAHVEKKYGTKTNTPNVLYYVIPDTMWEKNKEKIEQKLDKHYGVITFTGHNYHELSVVKKAKKLHKNKVSSTILHTIVARMSSEIAGLSTAHYMYVQNITGLGRMISKDFDLKELEE